MGRSIATVNVDIDPLDVHLRGYGVQDAPPDASVYTVAVPRLLERFAAHGVRATFFVVARDAGTQAATIARIAAAGHEIASHSLTHPAPLARLAEPGLRHELTASKQALEQASGGPVVGFRAPNWDCNARVLRTLADLGYRYDASSYPSPFLLAARLVVGGFGRLRSWPFSWQRWPHDRDGLHEFPVPVHGPLRTPVYHTLRYRMTDAAFTAIADRFAGAARPFAYALHAIDALAATDGVDPRLHRHPGMALPLDDKLGVLDRTLRCLGERFALQPFRDQLPAAATAITAGSGTGS